MIRTNFLKSERLHLTPLRKADIETIQSWETDLHYMRNLDTGPALPGTREAIERRFQDMLDGKTSDEVMLMMRRPGEDHAIGFVGLDGSMSASDLSTKARPASSWSVMVGVGICTIMVCCAMNGIIVKVTLQKIKNTLIFT